ncbi:MAG: peptidase S8, partial [Betaproteobacteria bacterium]
MRPSLRHAAMSLAFAWVAPFAAAAGVDETPAYWFVELAGRPVADGGIPASVRAEKAAFRANARSAGIELRERFAYDKLFNGLSVSVPRGQLARLSQLDGVKAVYPVGRVAR